MYRGVLPHHMCGPMPIVYVGTNMHESHEGVQRLPNARFPGHEARFPRAERKDTLMRVRLIFVFVVVATLVVPIGAASAASPEAVSDGCQAVNEANFDGLSMSGGVSGLEFSRGEVLTVVADEPHDFGTPLAVSIAVNWSTVDADAFPGTVSFEFPEDGEYATVGWIVDGGNATWDISCEAPEREAGETVNIRQDSVDRDSVTRRHVRSVRRAFLIR